MLKYKDVLHQIGLWALVQGGFDCTSLQGLFRWLKVTEYIALTFQSSIVAPTTPASRTQQ